MSTQRKAAAALGLISAIGAYGGFLIPQVLNLSSKPAPAATPARSSASSAPTSCCSCSPAVVYVRQRATRTRDLTSMTDMTTVAASADTHCPYCALQCAMTLTPADAGGGGRGPAVIGRRSGLPDQPRRPVQEGLDLGRTAPLTRPPRPPRCVRGADGALHETELGRGARPDRRPRCAASARRTGPTPSASSAAAGLTNEKAYQLGKFARLALGTSRIDYNGRFCMSSAAAAGNRAFGVDRGLPFPLEDLDGAITILLLGSNVAETMPPFIGHLAGAQDAGRPDRRRPAPLGDRAAHRRRRAACTCSRRPAPTSPCCWASPTS